MKLQIVSVEPSPAQYEWGGRLELIKALPPLGTTEPAGVR